MQYNYVIIIERSKRYYWASVPDLPGCVSAGKTLEELHTNIREAIELHLEGMVEDGLAIPKPTSSVDVIAVDKPRRKAVRSGTHGKRVVAR